MIDLLKKSWHRATGVGLLPLLSALLSLLFAGYFALGLRGAAGEAENKIVLSGQALGLGVGAASGYTPRAAVSDVVAKALAFKALLSAAQVQTLEQSYTPTLARRWSNSPCVQRQLDLLVDDN